MTSFSQKAEIDEAIMDSVIERMMGTFVKDISPVVRMNAFMALQRLQDPENPEDPVTKVYIYHMESDPIAKVRQTAVTAIAKKLPIINHILDRLQDNDEKVRRHTYLQMAAVPVKSYKIVDRIKFLDAGLHDRSELVKKAVNNVFLPNWIASYDYDYTEFIRAIKLDAVDKDLVKFRELAQDALSAIFM
jgi:condensin complex subunit 3